MQVDVDPGPGWVAVVIWPLSVVQMFVHSQLLLVNYQVVGPLINILEAADVLVLVTDADVVDGVADVVVEVEEAVDEQGPLDG